MTDNELKKLVSTLAVSQKETDTQIKELSVSQKETDTQIKELSMSQKETDTQIKAMSRELSVSQKETSEQIKEAGKKLSEVSQMFGGISKSQGFVAEDFFYNSFIKDNHLGSLSFDDITKNMEKHRGRMHEEYDIFLTNGESIAIIEVKYRARISDLKQLNRKFNNFKDLFPIYKDYKLYGGMASFHFNQETKDELLNQGYFIVERSGDLIKTENSDYLKVA